MSKINKRMIVETTGAFGLGDRSVSPAQEIDAFRPSVVKASAFLGSRIGLGQVRILVDDLPETANDADFAKTLSESESLDLALDAYTAEVSGDVESEKPKAKAKSKK